jgi:hypothetical protein
LQKEQIDILKTELCWKYVVLKKFNLKTIESEKWGDRNRKKVTNFAEDYDCFFTSSRLSYLESTWMRVHETTKINHWVNWMLFWKYKITKNCLITVWFCKEIQYIKRDFELYVIVFF